MIEFWKDINGFEGHYQVSDAGRVRSLKKNPAGMIMKPLAHTGGYQRIVLWLDGNDYQFFIHKLVLEAFSGPRPQGMQACHINGLKQDNRLENLRWDTPSANQADREKHGTGRIGKPKPVKKLDCLTVDKIRKCSSAGLNITQISRALQLPRTTIADVANGRTWKAHK